MSATNPEDGGRQSTMENEESRPKPKTQQQREHFGGMTPSIITTINNTSPSPVATNANGNIKTSNNSIGTQNKNRRPPEPYYESYIEDSFVGHWEREDDDDVCDDETNHDDSEDVANNNSGQDARLNPSTIEFDFDSFGPESFIYTPAAVPKTETIVEEEETLVESKESKQSTDKRDFAEQLAPQQQQQPQQEKKEQGDDRKQEQDDEESKGRVIFIERQETPVPGTSFQASPITAELESAPIEYLVDHVNIDLKVIEPYRKVISHAGYCHHFDTSIPASNPNEPAPAVIVFSACYLPDRSRRDYDYVMDHLFLYVLSSLHELIADDYILIYLHNTQPSSSILPFASSASSSSLAASTSAGSGSASATTTAQDGQKNNLPTFTWMKRCYQMIDRKLRKNLRILYLVKPTFWLKTIVIMSKPFISAKFSKKLRFIENMDSLKKCLPVDKLILPASADNL